MDFREKLVDLLAEFVEFDAWDNGEFIEKDIDFCEIAEKLIDNGVTVQEWIPVTERLPEREEKSEPWKQYNVVVLRSHWPTSSYDLCDAPYDEKIVTTASYDSEQKIWHLDWGEQLNALIDIEDSPLNGDYVTHWMPLPQPPKGE